MGFAEKKKVFFEIDARWNVRLGIRMLMNMLCVISIAMAVMTIEKGKSTYFRPKPFEKANIVLVYVICDGITVAWNMFNIILFIVKQKNVAHWLNTLAHFLLGFGFAVVGVFVTVVAVSGYKGMDGNLYTDPTPYQTTAVNGSQITVTSDNIASCPAFNSCQEQAYWVSGAKGRSLISVIGCSLFDAVFLLHVAFFFWCMNDSVFGLRGRSQRQMDKSERARLRAQTTDVHLPTTSESEKPFDLSSKPSISIDERYNSEYSFEQSQFSDIEMSPRRHTAMPEWSRSSMTLDTQHTPRYPSLPPSIPPTLVLRPSPESRDSLSLSIFDTSPSSAAPPPRASFIPPGSGRSSRNITPPLVGYGPSISPTGNRDSTSTYDRMLQQQQLQQLQQMQLQGTHKHQSGCTCSQSRTSYASAYTPASRAQRSSSETSKLRQSVQPPQNNAAASAKPTVKRTDSVRSAVSTTSTSSEVSGWAPSYPISPPVPTAPVPVLPPAPVLATLPPLPAPQAYGLRQPAARSSLRHSISPAEILDRPRATQTSSSLIAAQPAISSARSSLTSPPQPQYTRPARSSLSSVQAAPATTSVAQRESRNYFEDQPTPLADPAARTRSSTASSYGSSPAQLAASRHRQSGASMLSNPARQAQSPSPRRQSQASTFSTAPQLPPANRASNRSSAASLMTQMHQALPDVLSPEEKDLTALPVPPSAAVTTITTTTTKDVNGAVISSTTTTARAPGSRLSGASSLAATKRNTLRKSALRFEM